MTHEEMIVKYGGPLTLEQLQEMNGQPVWVEKRDGSIENSWGIVCITSGAQYVMQFITVPQGYAMLKSILSEYGNTWFAYAYPPANIYREKWEPCQSCDSKCLTCMINETDKCRRCKDYKYYLPLYQFCPKCGLPLTDQAWAELEKRLRVV